MKKVLIKVGPSECLVVSDDRDAVSVVVNGCRFKDSNAHFMPSFLSGRWDGYHTFWDWRRQAFPIGLLRRVIDVLEKNGVRYKIRKPDLPPVDPSWITPDCLYGVELRDYQVSSARLALMEERGWLELATNAGKTLVAAAIAKTLRDNLNIKTLVLVPNKTLLLKNAKEIGELLGPGYKIGVIGDGRRSFGDVTVSTAQTIIRGCSSWCKGKTVAYERALRKWNMNRRGPKPRPPSGMFDERLERVLHLVGCVIPDEGHHTSADTWQHILQTCTARFRIGMTGTYDLKDAKKQGAFTAYIGPLLKKVSNRQLIEAGHSAKVFVFAVTDESAFPNSYTQPTHERVKTRDGVARVEIDPLVRAQAETEALLGDKDYHASVMRMAAALVRGGIKPTVLASRLSHIGYLERYARKNRIRPIVVHGGTPANARLSMIDEFSRTDDAVLIGSKVFDEGVNIPDMGALFLTGGGRNIREVLQRVGRGLRVKSGINAVAVFDFAIYTSQFASKHFLQRLSIYEREHFTVIEVDSVDHFCKQARQGWRGILGDKRYERERKKRRSTSKG